MMDLKNNGLAPYESLSGFEQLHPRHTAEPHVESPVSKGHLPRSKRKSRPDSVLLLCLIDNLLRSAVWVSAILIHPLPAIISAIIEKF